ncbi:MAG: hypothetical protein V2A79_03750 [Planctomycetota bacterium]
MAFGADSKVFIYYMGGVLENTTAMDLDADTFNFALYNNTGTPDATVPAALSAYNAADSQWVTANEVTDATGWPAKGNPILTPTHAIATNVFTFDAPDLVSIDTHTTLTNVYGGLCFDDTIAAPVADQGVCFNSFGGVNSVTAGQFTVVFAGTGIFTVTV